MNSSQKSNKDKIQENESYEEVVPYFPHRASSDVRENISHSILQTTSLASLLMGLFDTDRDSRVDNETIFYGITTVRNGVEDINSYISCVTDTVSINASSPANVLSVTMAEMTGKVKDVLDLLHDQFGDDKDCLLNNETIHAIFKSVRTDITKIAGVADDLVGMLEKQQA